MTNVIFDDFDRIIEEYRDVIDKLRNKSVLITGSTGMIASYLARFLIYISEDYNIKVILQCRNIEKGKRYFLDSNISSNVHIVDYDFENVELPINKINYIIHAASPASTKIFKEKPIDVISPNVIGTWNLLNYCLRQKVDRFIYLSSNSIYGEGGIDKNILTENDYGVVNPLGERACYIESKRMAEQMCIAFARQYSVDANIVRICHTYGPTFDIENDTRIIPRIIYKMKQKEKIEYYKDPTSVVQYTYVADMISAILIVLLNGESGQVYNAGGDEIVKMDTVIKWMANANKNTQYSIIEKEIDEGYNFSKGKGINFVKLSNDKIKSIGWKIIYSNEEGFKRTVNYYLS